MPKKLSVKPGIYKNLRHILDALHFSDFDPSRGWDLLVDLLSDPRRLRPINHERLGINFSFCDNSEYRRDVIKRLALGLVYLKPDKTETCDTFLIDSDDRIKYVKDDRELKAECPKLEWNHKIQVWKIKPS